VLSERVEKGTGVTLSAVSLIVVFSLFLLCLFLFREGFVFFEKYPFLEFFSGEYWYPTSSNPRFGLIPLILGTLLVTFGSMCVAIPIGLASAIYISEIASPGSAFFLKSVVEILAGIPSVVFGFFGLVVMVPLIQDLFGLATGQTALTGAIILGVMALPTVISISEDAISSVPKSLKDGALALGSTKWQTIYKVVMPAALSGITASIMLGMGRAIGETMTVMMVTGNMAIIPGFPEGIIQPVRTMTATIALEMGEVPQGSDHYHALFAVGIVLFILTFLINMVADYVKRRFRLMDQ